MTSVYAPRPQVTADCETGAAMIDFLARWYRLGGGRDGDIWNAFGLSPREYFTRVLEVQADHLAPSTLAGIRSVARRRLWLAS